MGHATINQYPPPAAQANSKALLKALHYCLNLLETLDCVDAWRDSEAEQTLDTFLSPLRARIFELADLTEITQDPDIQTAVNDGAFYTLACDHVDSCLRLLDKLDDCVIWELGQFSTPIDWELEQLRKTLKTVSGDLSG